MHRNTLKGTIDGIFVDLITHNYTFVDNPIKHEGVRMLSKPDISAMKINAISGDGTRSKDFIDVYFLLKEFSFENLLVFIN